MALGIKWKESLARRPEYASLLSLGMLVALAGTIVTWIQ